MEVGCVGPGCEIFGLGGDRQTERRLQEELRAVAWSASVLALDQGNPSRILLVEGSYRYCGGCGRVGGESMIGVIEKWQALTNELISSSVEVLKRGVVSPENLYYTDPKVVGILLMARTISH